MGDGAWLSSATTTSTRVRHDTCIVSQPTLSNGRRRDTIDYSWLQHAHYSLCDLSARCQKWSCLGILPLPPLLVVGRVIMVSSSCHSMWAYVPVCIALSAIRLLFLLVMYHARARTDGAELVHSPFRRLFDMLLCDLYACLFSLAGLWHETGARKCGACRVPGHRVTHCPLNVEGNVRCRCSDPSCGPCSASCAVCKVVGHQPDNVEALIVGRAGPRWSCAKHDVEKMQGRLQPALLHIRPTVRAQKETTRGQKRVLAGTRPSDGERFRAHVAQSEIIDLTGLGGAAAAPAIRTAAAVAAVAQDAGASREAGRMLGAFVSDVGTQRSGGTAQPIPGALGAVNFDESKADVIASIREALKTAPKYSSDTRAARRRCNREAGLGSCGFRTPLGTGDVPRSTAVLGKDRHERSWTLVRMDCMPMSGRSIGQLLDLDPKIVPFGLKMTEFEPRTRILPASIELSGDYSRHAHNTLEQFLKCTIVLSTCVPFGSAKIGQTAIQRMVVAAARPHHISPRRPSGPTGNLW